MSEDAVARIAQARPGLRPSEQRVADAILADPASIVDLPITELAERCSTSVATVVRFCQAAGYAGCGELRLELASTRGREEVSLGRFGVSDGEIEADDDAHDVLAKVAYHEAHAIESTASSVDTTTLDAVAGAIAKADRVDIYGVGSSALAAIDLQQKLHRIGLVSFYNSDIHLALTSGALLTGRSVSVGFSHSGLSVETVDSLSTARLAGGGDRGGDELPGLADRRAGRPCAGDQRLGDPLPAGRDVQPDRTARGGRLPLRAPGAAAPRPDAAPAAAHLRRGADAPAAADPASGRLSLR
ncbi:MurR/RpiR family transcriptional regulator [Leifsonia xyli]|uniref:MurR/RpiR family transcriptional regulator n=1 Tax=Leifsonia xyli TaxID=1575 RepID=UPI0002D3E164|nr:MurR/RpiR family transcriptional regulator [Leifsonia xyli]